MKLEEREEVVKVEQEEVSCQQEEERAKTDVPSVGSGELPTLPSIPSWNVSFADFGYYFDGYAFIPFRSSLQPFLS